MLVGREEQLEALQKIFGKLASSIVVLYGKTGMGKTSLVREFMKNKDSFYYSAIPAAADEARLFMANCVYGPSELNGYLTNYEDVFVGMTKDNKVKKVIVIDEFLNISRSDNDFLEAVVRMVKNQADYGRVMVILISSSISYIENNKKKLFKDAATFTTYMKLEELSFMDTMRFFASYPIDDCVRFFGITGGVPQYISKISKKQPLKENICRNIISESAFLHNTGHDCVREELRETGLYNTILGCLASGMNKINDIYNYTGFGRDKISVYLKNLIERDIVEKVYSYDVSGKDNIKKGCYRIKPGYLWFWYKYIYPNQTDIVQMESEEFYKEHIEDDLDEFMNEAFIQVCDEYMQLLEEHGGIKIKTIKKSRVYEKDARIDIIRLGEDGVNCVGMCEFSSEPMKEEVLEKLGLSLEEAKLSVEYVYLFARSGFSEGLKKISKNNDSLILVDISDL